MSRGLRPSPQPCNAFKYATPIHTGMDATSDALSEIRAIRAKYDRIHAELAEISKELDDPTEFRA